MRLQLGELLLKYERVKLLEGFEQLISLFESFRLHAIEVDIDRLFELAGRHAYRVPTSILFVFSFLFILRGSFRIDIGVSVLDG